MGRFLRVLLKAALENTMIKLICVAAVALILGASAQAMPRVPLHQSEGITTQVAYGCGVGRTRINGVCVSRRHIRGVRRCVLWGVGHVCRRWRRY
jgi:hypothetical protein